MCLLYDMCRFILNFVVVLYRTNEFSNRIYICIIGLVDCMSNDLLLLAVKK